MNKKEIDELEKQVDQEAKLMGKIVKTIQKEDVKLEMGIRALLGILEWIAGQQDNPLLLIGYLEMTKASIIHTLMNKSINIKERIFGKFKDKTNYIG